MDTNELQQNRAKFDALLLEVKRLKIAHDAGRGSFEAMHQKACEACEVFNATSEAIAKKFKRPVKRVTASHLIRNLDFRF